MVKLDIIDLFKKENLSDEEQLEIYNHDEDIYYYNKNKDSVDNNHQNRLILRAKNHIFYRYEVIHALGRGAFSNVYLCKDHKRNINVSVKVIRNEERFHKQANKCEIPALLKIADINHKNLVKVLKIFDYNQHICISFELLKTDLYEKLKKNKFTPFDINTVKKYSKQILLGLEALISLDIIHCDLKPENIMVTNDDNIKIIDLGSCYIVKKKRLITNTYIQSRYYRSPEVILGCDYSFGIDIWSFGCIVFEMLTGKPLFQARSQNEILSKIVKLIGFPEQKMVLDGSKSHSFFIISEGSVQFKTLTEHDNVKPLSNSFEKLYKTEDIALHDFLKKIINWDYLNRPHPSILLCHEFISN